ncbi:MAG: SipW-dependent-type signal peptide-containing protein [Cellulomonas sp.]
MSADQTTRAHDETTEVRRTRDRRSRGRLRAVLAGAGVLGIGAAVTLAAWTDTEWIFGGTDSDGTPIGTTVFEIQQNVYDGQSFQNRENWPTDATAGRLNFTVAAASLSPGAVVYAPMQLRAAPGSVGGTVVLNAAQQGTGTDPGLFGALVYQARTGVSQASCNAAGISGGTALAPASTPLGTGGSASFTVAGAPDATTAGTPVDVCFQITMPATATGDALQGKAVVPVWSFTATSQS